MAAKSSHEYFVSVESPSDVRKALLESSRDIIHILQSHERLKTLRKEKDVHMQKLDGVMNDIYTISNKVKNILPKLPAKKKHAEKEQKKQIEETKEKVQIKKKVTPTVAVKQNFVPKEKSSLELLEEELLNVEKQLNEMD